VLRRRRLLVVVVVLGYVGALVLTMRLGPEHARPLYDGFTGPPSYRWVDPPDFFASGNQPPSGTSSEVPVGRSGSQAVGVATPDGQLVLDLPRGAISPQPDARTATIHIQPLASGGLGRLPGGLRPNGNAYRVTIRAGRGGRVRHLDRAGTMVVEIPELGTDLFRSVDGRHWTGVPARPLPPRNLSLTATFDRPGYYVGGTRLPELVLPPDGSSDSSLVLGFVVAGVAAVFLVLGFVIVRRRRRAPPPVTG
jgi:hypothetical protein